MRESILNSLAFFGIGANNEFALIILLFIAVFIILLVGVILNLFIRKLLMLAGKTKTLWDDAILNSFNGPLRLFIWSVGLTYTAEVIWHDLGEELLRLVGNIRSLAVIVALAWFTLRLLNHIERNIKTKNINALNFDMVGIRAVNKVLKTSVVITALLIALSTMGYSISGVLAFGGIGGIAVGFAARDLLANFFGSLMIYIDRPFTEGERIRVDNGNIVGEVEEIGWRLTKVRTFEKKLVHIPNSMFANMAIENISKMTHRRIREIIGVRYNDVTIVPIIATQIEVMINNDAMIDTNQSVVVKLNCFNASSVDILVNAYTKITDWVEYHQFKQQLMMKISDIISENGAEIAFPTTTVHIAQSSDNMK